MKLAVLLAAAAGLGAAAVVPDGVVPRIPHHVVLDGTAGRLTGPCRGNAVVEAICRHATGRVRLAMLMGARLESSWARCEAGDHGHSWGPYQINLPFHPDIDRAGACDPDAATRYMLPRYQGGAAQVPDGLWRTDPAWAAATAARHAEQPAAMYSATRVRQAWPLVRAAAGK